MEKKKFSAYTWGKFLLFSVLGVVFFFVNVPYRTTL